MVLGCANQEPDCLAVTQWSLFKSADSQIIKGSDWLRPDLGEPVASKSTPEELSRVRSGSKKKTLKQTHVNNLVPSANNFK